MREIIERHLLPDSGGRYRIEACRLAFLRRRDGTRGTVQYDVRVVEPTTGRGWDEVVTAVAYGPSKTRRIWDALRLAEPPSPIVPDSPALPRVAYVPELEMLLQVFPYDYRLPALARMVEGPPPHLLPPWLARFGAREWRLDAWEAEAVRYRVDLRVTLRLDVRARRAAADEVAERRFYAKVYRDDEEGQRGHDAQRAVHERATAVAAPFVTAAPIVYAPDLRTLVQEALPGTPLLAILREKGDPVPAARAAARAAAAFHQLDLPALPRPRRGAVTRLDDAATQLRLARPDLTTIVAETVAVVSAGLADAPIGPTHADLKPDHFLIDGDRVALIDFDLMVADDPVGDVANLLIHFARARPCAERRRDAGEAAAAAFVDEYFARVPPSWRARLPLHQATASLTKAAALYRSGAPGRADLAEAAIADAHAAVANGGR